MYIHICTYIYIYIERERERDRERERERARERERERSIHELEVHEQVEHASAGVHSMLI